MYSSSTDEKSMSVYLILSMLKKKKEKKCCLNPVHRILGKSTTDYSGATRTKSQVCLIHRYRVKKPTDQQCTIRHVLVPAFVPQTLTTGTSLNRYNK